MKKESSSASMGGEDQTHTMAQQDTILAQVDAVVEQADVQDGQHDPSLLSSPLRKMQRQKLPEKMQDFKTNLRKMDGTLSSISIELPYEEEDDNHHPPKRADPPGLRQDKIGREEKAQFKKKIFKMEGSSVRRSSSSELI
mmetsp:Transcript_22445/g.46770  ORF Transcript_22445/g.46770 Transcript_22445/m.46770 type:complete len:140 (-) Transcript_22445:469-888(-)